MNFHGFPSPQEWAKECIARGWQIRFLHFRRTAPSDFQLPPGLVYTIITPQFGDKHTDISADPPEELVAIADNPRTSPSAVTTWNVFSSDFSKLYADGIEADCRRVLELWGYTEEENQ